MPIWDCYRKPNKVCNTKRLFMQLQHEQTAKSLSIDQKQWGSGGFPHMEVLAPIWRAGTTRGCHLRLHFTSDPAGTRAVPRFPSWAAERHQRGPRVSADLCCQGPEGAGGKKPPCFVSFPLSHSIAICSKPQDAFICRPPTLLGV